MTNGNVTLNGVTEKQVAQILQFKTANEGKFVFTLMGVQAMSTQQAGGPIITYNNVNLSWNTDANLKVLMELLAALI
jgi:hypothetical protein